MSGWTTVRLGDVCDVIAGQSPPGTSYNGDGDGLPFYQGKRDFGVREIGAPSSWTTAPTKLALPGDILMSVRAPVGPVNFLTETACIGRGLAAIRAGERIDRDFLFYNLLMREPEISGREGAVFASINRSEIAALAMVLPPLDQQRQIVAVLDEAFAAVATATLNAEKNLANAHELRIGYLNSQLGASQSEPWGQVSLSEVCEVLDRFRKPVTKSDRRAGEYPYYGATGIVDWVDEYIFDETLVLLGEDGAKWGAGERSAFSASGKYWVNNHAHIMRPNRNIIANDWLIYSLNMTDLMPYVTGVTVPKLNQERMRSIPISLPPLEKQVELVAKMDALRDLAGNLAALNEQKIADLAALKQSLLESAFSGQLTKPDSIAA